MHWIWILLIGLVAVVGYGFYVWQAVAYSIEVSKPIAERTKIYEQHPVGPSTHILIAGDSIGVGVGATNNQDSLAGRIGQHKASADITNIAVSGARLADLEKKLHEVAAEKYDLVLISIGGNDITQGTKFSDVEASLSRVLSKASVLGKKVVVLTAGNVGLCPAFKWPLSLYIEHRTREVRKIFIEEVAKHPNALYLDLFKEAKDEPFNKDIPRYYAPDFFHPSGEGYGLWFEKLKPLL